MVRASLNLSARVAKSVTHFCEMIVGISGDQAWIQGRVLVMAYALSNRAYALSNRAQQSNCKTPLLLTKINF